MFCLNSATVLLEVLSFNSRHCRYSRTLPPLADLSCLCSKLLSTVSIKKLYSGPSVSVPTSHTMILQMAGQSKPTKQNYCTNGIFQHNSARTFVTVRLNLHPYCAMPDAKIKLYFFIQLSPLHISATLFGRFCFINSK